MLAASPFGTLKSAPDLDTSEDELDGAMPAAGIAPLPLPMRSMLMGSPRDDSTLVATPDSSARAPPAAVNECSRSRS